MFQIIELKSGKVLKSFQKKAQALAWQKKNCHPMLDGLRTKIIKEEPVRHCQCGSGEPWVSCSVNSQCCG